MSELRPDWGKIYGSESGPDPDHSPKIDGALVTVTRETVRLALTALRQSQEREYFHNYAAAVNELTDILKINKR